MATFKVTDMSCAHCVSMIETKLRELNQEVSVDLSTKSVTVEDALVEQAKASVTELGYTVG